MNKLIVKALPIPKMVGQAIIESFTKKIDSLDSFSRIDAVSVLTNILSQVDDFQAGVFQFKIVTPADIKSAKVFYSQNIKKQIPLMLTVEKWRMKHTKSQRGLLHAIIDEIAIHTGSDREFIKAGIKEHYGVKVEWKGTRFPKPSSDMNTVEYGMLIDGAIIEAGELGIELTSHKHEWEEYKKNNSGEPHDV